MTRILVSILQSLSRYQDIGENTSVTRRVLGKLWIRTRIIKYPKKIKWPAGYGTSDKIVSNNQDFCHKTSQMMNIYWVYTIYSHHTRHWQMMQRWIRQWPALEELIILVFLSPLSTVQSTIEKSLFHIYVQSSSFHFRPEKMGFRHLARLLGFQGVLSNVFTCYLLDKLLLLDHSFPFLDNF